MRKRGSNSVRKRGNKKKRSNEISDAQDVSKFPIANGENYRLF